MSFDAHANLAISTIVTPPSPSTSGTNLTVTAGEGVRFPAVPFNAMVWPASQPPTPGNAELVRVTFKSGDQLGLTRAVESSTARSIVAGDLIAATITAKVITDIEAGTNFPQITTAAVRATDLILTADGGLHRNTNDGADTGYLQISGGGNTHPAYGGTITLYGNEHAGAGAVLVAAGLTPTSNIQFVTGPAQTLSGQIFASGGVSWGGAAATDPGANNVGVIGNLRLSATLPSAAGKIAGYFNGAAVSGLVLEDNSGVSGVTYAAFMVSNLIIGSITRSGTGTAVLYNTTSDARLKTDRGLLTDPEVLRSTRVHHFTWNTDGTSGRGVFAQEAIAVLPSAVSIGTDERDEHGNLKQPWGVDYSKYVPDLIAGWQYHDQRFDQLGLRITALEAASFGTSTPPVRPSMLEPGGIIKRMITAIRAWWTPSDIESEAHQVARP